MNQIYAIAQNTFREAVRNRIFASLILFAIVMLGAALAMSSSQALSSALAKARSRPGGGIERSAR